MQELADGQTEEQLPVFGYVFDIGNIRVCFPEAETPYNVIDFAEMQDPFYRDKKHKILYDYKWREDFTVHYDELLNQTFLIDSDG